MVHIFTGIVEEVGRVRNLTKSSQYAGLFVECNRVLEGTRLGDSIAVNGICLTVTELGDHWFAADVMPETFRKTNLEKLLPKDGVNLERALRLSDRLGGHLVSGHVDGTGTVIRRQVEDNAVWLTIEAPVEILRYIIVKGSVALDGTSLTVARAGMDSFSVSLIPLTAGVTTLGFRKPGDRINIECDVVGKYIERLLRADSGTKEENSRLSLSFLKENGFA